MSLRAMSKVMAAGRWINNSPSPKMTSSVLTSAFIPLSYVVSKSYFEAMKSLTCELGCIRIGNPDVGRNSSLGVYGLRRARRLI